MSGLYGSISLGSNDSTTHQFEIVRALEHQLSDLCANPVYHRLIQSPTACIGGISPSGTSLHARQIHDTDSGTMILYFGDGRMTDHALSEIVNSRNYSELTGFYLLVHLDTATALNSSGIEQPVIEQCTLVQDRCGNFPLAYHWSGNTLTFSPSIDSLQRCVDTPFELDPAGLGFLLSGGYIPGTRTQYKSITQAASGTSITVQPARNPTIHRYWRVPVSRTNHYDEQALLKEGARSITEAVNVCFDQPERTAVFLSGGADSRLIAQVCVNLVDNPADVTTVSWGTIGSDKVPGTDAFVAAKLAAHWGTSHRFFDKHTTDYTADFAVACRTTDWLSEVAWAHPQEWRIMQQLNAAGYRCCLRGDQPFASEGPAMSAEYARTQTGLLNLRYQPLAQTLLNPTTSASWADAIDEFLVKVPQPAHYSASDLRDTYKIEYKINNAHQYEARYKQVYLNHRSPLLDNSFLELFDLTQTTDRSYKRIYRKLLHHMSDETAGIAFSTSHSDPETVEYFRPGGMAYDHLQSSLLDTQSPVYEYFDHAAMHDLCQQLIATPKVTRDKSPMLRWSKRVARQMANRVAPKRYAQIASRRRSANSLTPVNAIGRFLVIKHFLDSHQQS